MIRQADTQSWGPKPTIDRQCNC